MLRGCNCAEGSFSHSRLKGFQAENTVFRRTDFFQTLLNGVDLSGCEIEGITVSDTYSELRGVRVTAEQAAGLALLLGVKIV